MLFGKPAESILESRSTLSTTLGLSKLVLGLLGESYDRLGGAPGRFQNMSPDGQTMLFQSFEEIEFVTRDPQRSKSLKIGDERVLCGDDYTGVAFDRKYIYPWFLTSSHVSRGESPAVARSEWLSVQSTGNGNLAQDGNRLVRLTVSADRSRIVREMEVPLSVSCQSFRENSATGVVVIERKDDFVVTPNLAITSSLTRLARSWKLIKPVGDGVALDDVAVAQDCYTAYGLRAYSPAPTLKVGVVQLFTWECDGRVSSKELQFPARRGLSAAISPAADRIAAVGEFYDGQNSFNIPHVWSIPDLNPVVSEVFESPCTGKATVDFDAFGEFVVVSSGSNRLVWHFDDSEKLRSVGTYSGGDSLQIGSLSARASTLVAYEINEIEGQCLGTFRWIDLKAPFSQKETPKIEID